MRMLKPDTTYGRLGISELAEITKIKSEFT
jgi:hypothetical protein